MADIKVYRMNDYEWWASEGSLEELIEFYRKNVDDSYSVEEMLEEVEVCDIDKDGMWWQTEDTSDLETLGDYDEVKNYIVDKDGKKKVSFGSLMRRDGEIFKFISYREAIKRNGEYREPYMIATTEW